MAPLYCNTTDFCHILPFTFSFLASWWYKEEFPSQLCPSTTTEPCLYVWFYTGFFAIGWIQRWTSQVGNLSCKEKDRSRRCQYIQSFDMFFVSILTFFDTLTKNDASNWLVRIHIHIRDEQVNFSRYRRLTCLVSKILFLAAILIFFSKTRSTILA